MSRAFILHDGEDDDKSAELDAFLTPLKAGGGEWEGDNNGITIWMPHVNVGDAIVVDGDGMGVRVYPKNEPVKITRHSFHFVHRAMLLVEYDHGAHHVNRIHPGTVDLETFTMPFEYGIDRLLNAEEALMWLSAQPVKIVLGDMREPVDVERPFEDFVAGDMEAVEEYIKEHRDEMPGLQGAHDLLNEWFNGWEQPFKWEKDPPFDNVTEFRR